MRRSLAGPVILLAVATLCGCGTSPGAHASTPTPSPKATPQEATGPGISVTVPANWLVVTSVTFSGIQMGAGEEPVLGLVDYGSGANQIGIERQTQAALDAAAGGPVTLEQLAKQASINVANNNHCPPTQAPVVALRQVAGEAAEAADVQCAQFAVRVVATSHEGEFYLAVLISKLTSFDDSAAAFEAMVNSWKWR
jgi:hypothetical protein